MKSHTTTHTTDTAGTTDTTAAAQATSHTAISATTASKTSIEHYRNSFAAVAMREGHPHWQTCTARQLPDRRKTDEIRSEFDRDADRILHSLAYTRLKSKTQVFFHTHDDRICTRIEHVNHVISVSGTIARFLGLNTELTQAIAMGHDLGHAPFGHRGETVLNDLCKQYDLGEFWHEQNSLRVIDALERLPAKDGRYQHLNLTYAVRDGIIAHCGEVNQQCLRTREEAIDLSQFSKYNRFDPYTWEGCVVKLSDKMAYLGRDLEDAQRLGLLGPEQLRILEQETARCYPLQAVNNTNLIHTFIIDLCRHSSPENGLRLSPECYELMKTVMRFNYRYIYGHERLLNYDAYAKLVLNSLFEVLSQAYDGPDTLRNLRQKYACHPHLSADFSAWLESFTGEPTNEPMADPTNAPTRGRHAAADGRPLYDLRDAQDYRRAIIDFLSLLTDRGILEYYTELTTF